ncbi:MAG: bifunctional nuclease family protein [Bacteroidales bacterium]|nr:bifunctional nuclease family protein [Bacteroidales bacterium]
MDKIQLIVSGVANQSNPDSTAYTLILSEKEGVRKLPIVIGVNEAQAIELQLEGLIPIRPLVYDLMCSFFSSFSIDIIEVIITNVDRGIFYAEIVCCNSGASNEDYIRIPARTSDAVAIALKVGCNIFTYEQVLNVAGFEWTAPGDDISNSTPRLEGVALPELKTMLKKAIIREDYEFASKIRDEIELRSKD